MKHLLKKFFDNLKLLMFIKKIYWRIKDFSLSHYISIKKDNFLINFKLIIRFKRKFFNFNFFSQQNEDKYLLYNFNIDQVKNGTYLEVGAYDGIYCSNTYFLYNQYCFTGILIEPQPSLYNSLKKNRLNDFLVNAAITNSNDEYTEFIGNNLEAGVYDKISTDLTKFPDWNKYLVKNKKMSEIIKLSSFKYLDIMFIDTEGSELEIIQSIDFSFPIKLIVVEAHKDKKQRDEVLKTVLINQGYIFLYQIRGNYWFYNESFVREGGLELRNYKKKN